MIAAGLRAKLARAVGCKSCEKKARLAAEVKRQTKPPRWTLGRIDTSKLP